MSSTDCNQDSHQPEIQLAADKYDSSGTSEVNGNLEIVANSCPHYSLSPIGRFLGLWVQPVQWKLWTGRAQDTGLCDR